MSPSPAHRRHSVEEARHGSVWTCNFHADFSVRHGAIARSDDCETDSCPTVRPVPLNSMQPQILQQANETVRGIRRLAYQNYFVDDLDGERANGSVRDIICSTGSWPKRHRGGGLERGAAPRPSSTERADISNTEGNFVASGVFFSRSKRTRKNPTSCLKLPVSGASLLTVFQLCCLLFLLPVGSAQSLSTAAIESFWSSDPVVIPNFVSHIITTNSESTCPFEVTFVGGDPTIVAAMPSVDCNGTLTLALNSGRVGGQASFSVRQAAATSAYSYSPSGSPSAYSYSSLSSSSSSVSSYSLGPRRVLPSSSYSSISLIPSLSSSSYSSISLIPSLSSPSTSTSSYSSISHSSTSSSYSSSSDGVTQTFALSVFVGSVDFNLQADANANLSVSVVAQNLAAYLGVEEEQLAVTDLLSSVNASRRLLGTAVSLQGSVRVYTASSALAIVNSLNSTLLSSLYGAPVSVSGVAATFRDIAGRTALVLAAEPTITVRDDAGLVSIPTLLAQVLAPELPIGGDGMPVYVMSVRVKQWRQSSSTGPLGAWQQSGEPSSLLLAQGSNGNCSVCLDGGNVSFTVLEGAGGEVVVELSALNGSALSELNITILPRSAAPSFALAPFPSSIPENTDFAFSVLSLSRGGWRLASALPVRFEFETSGVPVIQDIEFSDNCTSGAGSCDAVLKLYPMRFGSTTLTLTMLNDGASFTPYFADSYNVSVSFDVTHENVVPTFVLASDVVRVEEDAACVLAATAAGSLTQPVCDTTIPWLHRYDSFASVLLGMFEEQTATACPPAAGWTTVPGACLNQSGTFSLAHVAGDASIFTTLPALSAAGTLSFTLAQDRNGQATFNVTLADDGAPTPQSSSQLLTIFIFPINDAPTFSFVLSASLVLTGDPPLTADPLSISALSISETEGKPPRAKVIIATVDPGPFETGQSVTLSIAARPGGGAAALLSAFRISGGDTLLITLRPEAFGEAYLDVTAKDNGGVAREGVDTSVTQTIYIRVFPVNSPPAFILPKRMVRVRESEPEEVVIEGFATDISAGSANEDCAVATVSCQSQQVSFRIDHVERGFLFSSLPAVSSNGTLAFRIQPFTSGASRVQIRLQDDGGPGTGNDDSSPTLSFDVVVEPFEHVPSFALARQVECLTLDTRTPGTCTCPPTTENQFSLHACGRADPTDTASVWVLKDAGNVSIEAFATHITSAKDYLHASMTIFTLDDATGRLRFQEQRQDPVAGATGLEFSTDVVASRDGAHVYALEYDLDALLIFGKNGSALEFLDRRESVERRLRFAGFNSQDRFDRTPLALSSGATRSLSLMEAAGKQFVLAATGADLPAKDVERRRTRAATAPMTGFPYEPQDLWDATAALWMFSAADAFAPVSTPAADVAARFSIRQADWPITNAQGVWNRPYTVTCTDQGCSMSRSRNSLDTDSCVLSCPACSESNPTLVQAASIRDLTGKAGPLVLLGPACKSKASPSVSDWDVADSQMDVRTFLMTNHEVDAMQFDGSLHPGLYLTLDINKVVTGDPSTSKLPQGNFTVEMWFTIDVDPQDASVATADLDLRGLIGSVAYRQTPYCGRGWAVGYRHSVARTTLEWHLFLERTKGDAGAAEWQLQFPTGTLAKGVWQHLVAVYDEAAATASVFLNGARLGQPRQACAEPPCGKPVYPGSFNRPSQCDNKPFNFSVGVFYNGLKFRDEGRPGAEPVLVHQGAIHMVRLYDVALDAAAVAQQFSAKAAQMARNPLEPTYWTASAQAGREAPQFDFVDMGRSSDLIVRGVLDPSQTYRCEWLTGAADELSASVARVSYDTAFQTHVVECHTPLWPHGVRVSTFRVARWTGEEWKPVWMKVCLDAECGFPTTTQGRAQWFWGTGTNDLDTRLKNNVDALPFRFRFVSASALLQMEMEQEVGGGAVEQVTIQSAGTNYVNGRFTSDNVGDGRLLSGRFTVDGSGAVVSTTIDARGMAYPPGGGNVVLLDDLGHRMTNAITNVNLSSSGLGYLSGIWEIVGASGSNARGTFDAIQTDDATTTGQVTDIQIVVAGSDYLSDPVESDLRFYFTGTQKEQEGAITRVLGTNGFISGLTTSVPCVANCSDSGCTGSGFVGICVKGTGLNIMARVDVVDPGEGYNRDVPPEMFCVLNGGFVLPGGATLIPIIPSRPSLSISRAQGASISFETRRRGLQDLSIFELARGGMWSNSSQRPLWPAAASFTPFTVDNSTYFLHANWWDGVVGNKFVVSNAGRQMEQPRSFLYSWNPYTGMMACVQSLETAGASEWVQFSNSGGNFVAVANYQQILPDGETSTRAWSRIYSFGNNPNPGAGGGSCGAASAHGFSPIDEATYTEFATMGATGLETLVMNHTTRLSLVQYLVVSNYYDSETDATMVPSKLYMLGKPVSSTQSLFGIASTVGWRTCSDTGAACSAASDCFVHTCSDRCIVSRRGNVVDKVCRCSNRASQFCRQDDECFSGITCAYGGVAIDPEDHAACFAGGKVRFVGTNYDNLVTACEVQSFDVERATDVAYVRQGARHFLVFSSDSEQPTQAFVTQDGSEPFVLLQSVRSKFASSVRFFFSPLADHLYLILTQRQEQNSLVLRWNGESFVVDHPIEIAGGQSGLHFHHRGLEYGVFGGSTSSVDGSIMLFRADDNTLPSLDGPISVAISPDGTHVYVASLSSGTILCFLRQPVEGTLALLSETRIATLGSVSLSGVNPTADDYGYPVRGILDVLVSEDGLNVYLAASQDNAIHTFLRNATSGELQYLSSVTDEDRSKMMQGPRQLVATADGTRVYAVCLHSQSVVALDRSPVDGNLTYRDSMVNGERRVVSLQAEVRPGGGEGYPVQLGAEEEESWKDAARAAEAFTIGSHRFLAVASSDDQPATEGTAVVLWWNATAFKFELFQELRAETSASDVEFFEVTNLDGVRFSYLAVANLRGSITVYVWDAAVMRFAKHHSVPAVSLPYNVTSGCGCRCEPGVCGACFEDLFSYFPQCPPGETGCQFTDLALSPRKLKHFMIAQTGEHFLAVANYNSVGSTCSDVYSVVYRWNGDAPRSNAQGQAVWGYGFEAFQALDTRGALDVDFMAVEEAGQATRNLLFVANFAEAGSGEATVWEHVPYVYNHMVSARAGRFELRQTITAPFVSAVHALQIEDGHYLAIAVRQSAPFAGDISVYSVGSPVVMKWDGSQFQTHQTLLLASIPDKTSYFPDPPPAPNVSAVPGAPTWASFSNLAGATSFTYFQDVDGEHYLLIAQSFCDPLTNRSACMAVVSQPQSTILQWDRTSETFTEMLAWADALYEEVHGEPVHAEIRRHHQAALRMPVGRALQFATMNVGEEVLLVACSADKGAVVIRFIFDMAAGFGGAFSLAVDSSHRYVYTVSEQEQAVVVIGLAPSLDSLGNFVSDFEHLQSLSQQQLRGHVDRVPQGLTGVRSVSVEEVDCTGYTVDVAMGPGSVGGGAMQPQPLAPGTTCTVAVVRGSVPRNQMPCSDHPATPVTVDPLEPPLECRELRLNTSRVNSSNPNLFAVEPYLVASGPQIGTLNFTLNPGQSGVARFEAQLSKAPTSLYDFPPTMLWSEVLSFDVYVQDINDAPTFVLLDVEVAMDGGVQEVVFAVNITAEGLGLANYSWEWEYAVNCSDASFNCTNGTVPASYVPEVFARDPFLRFEETETGLVGVISVAVVPFLHDEVQLSLRMNDGSEPDPMTGASHVSETKLLSILVVPVNYAPTFVPNPARIVMEEGEQQEFPNFVTQFYNGPPLAGQNQRFFYEVDYVEDVNVDGWDTTTIFEQFAVNGTTLTFRLNPDFNGEIVVYVRVSDDGGTALGGSDSSVVPFALTVLPVNDAPLLQGSGSSLFACATSDADPSQQVCRFEFNVTGVLVDTLREYERAFVVVHPLDEALVENTSFSVRVVSGSELFFDDPYVLPDGTLVLPLARAGRGSANIEVTISDSAGLSTTYPVRLRIDDFAALPPFTLRPMLEVVDGDGLRTEPLFAAVSSLESLPESARQYIRFAVECTTTAAGMFAQAPAIDSVGTLTWEVRAGFSGRALCSVVLQAQEAGIEDTAPQAFSVRVWPRPQIHSLQPGVLPARQRGAVVTVRGRNFGSLRSRGYSAEGYGNITVLVTGGLRGSSDAWTPCVTTTYVGDEELLCEVPEGEGRRDVKVEVLDRTNRTGVRAGGLVSADMWFVGMAEDEQCASIGMPWPHRQEGITSCGSRGFLGFSPVDAGQQGLGESMLNISSSVRSVSVMGGRVYVGGGFTSVNGQRVNSIFGWDGKETIRLQLGLDGSVAAMAAYVDALGGEKLVVAGSFTRAYTSAGSVMTGGVAVWDGARSQWEAAGGVQVHGVAMCVGARGGSVLVGGKFTAVGEVRAQNVAVFNGSAWHALGDGVVGEVYACAMSSAVMYVGGKVGKAGGEEVENVAGWNGKSWGALLDGECLHQQRSVCGINGRVLAMATVGEYLYVGGMFDMAGGKPANNVARFYSGVWEPLGGGVDGAVTVMSAMRVFSSTSGSCVYIAGEFRKATDLTGETDAGGLARWCVGDPVLVRTVGNIVVSEFWQAVDVPEGVRGVRMMAPVGRP